VPLGPYQVPNIFRSTLAAVITIDRNFWTRNARKSRCQKMQILAWS